MKPPARRVNIAAMIFLLSITIGPNIHSQEPAAVSLWNGHPFLVPKSFPVLIFHDSDHPGYLTAISREYSATITIFKKDRNPPNNETIRRMIQDQLRAEMGTETGPFRKHDGEEELNLQAHVQVVSDIVFLLLAPAENETECFREFIAAIKGYSRKDEPQEIHFSFFELSITILVFFSFLAFIVVTLKEYSTLTLKH